VIVEIFLRRLPVRFCELTDGPSYLLLSPGPPAAVRAH